MITEPPPIEEDLLTVADELRRRLLSGQYRGGEQLRDTDLSQEFGVARPTVRAAIQTLVADGLLERGRGRSAQVRSFTAEDAIDLYQVRRPIETAAVDLMLSRSPTGRGRERRAAAVHRVGGRRVLGRVADHDVAFHRAVFTAAGSVRLLRPFDEVSAELRLLIAQLRPAYASVSDLAHEHELLLVALRTGNAQRARVAWGEHFNHSERFFLDLIQERAR